MAKESNALVAFPAAPLFLQAKLVRVVVVVECLDHCFICIGNRLLKRRQNKRSDIACLYSNTSAKPVSAITEILRRDNRVDKSAGGSVFAVYFNALFPIASMRHPLYAFVARVNKRL
jgi:hypothetical protein